MHEWFAIVLFSVPRSNLIYAAIRLDSRIYCRYRKAITSGSELVDHIRNKLSLRLAVSKHPYIAIEYVLFWKPISLSCASSMKLIVYHNCYLVCNRIYQVCNCISISFHARLHTQCLSFAQQMNIFAHSKKIIAHLMLRLHNITSVFQVCTPNVWFAHPMFGLQSLHTQCFSPYSRA